MAAAKKPAKQVMDVSKPGKVPADASARPVIVGHKPQVQDPMVTPEEAQNPEATSQEQEIASPSASKKVITPLTEEDKPAEAETEPEVTEEPAKPADTEEAQADEPVEEQQETATETTETEATESPEENSPDELGESSDTAVVDAVADQVAAGKKIDQGMSEEEKKKQEALEKMVAEKKYFIPIGKVHHRKSNKMILIVTVLLFLVFVGLILAIDAEILDAGFDLPFDVIK